MVVLREARGVKYSTFVAPGQSLHISAEAIEIGELRSDFKVKGTVHGSTAIQGRLELVHLNLTEHHGGMEKIDQEMRDDHRNMWSLLKQRAVSA